METENSIVNVLVQVSTKSQIKAGVAPMGKMRIEVDLAQLSEDQREVFAILFNPEDGSLHEDQWNLYTSEESRPEWAQRLGAISHRMLELDHPATPDAIAMRLDAIIAKGKAKVHEEHEKAARRQEEFRNALTSPNWVEYTAYNEPQIKVEGVAWCDASRQQADDMGILHEYLELEKELKERAEKIAADYSEEERKKALARGAEEKKRTQQLEDWAQVYEPDLKKGYDDGIIKAPMLRQVYRNWFREEHGLGTQNTDQYFEYDSYLPGRECLKKYRDIEIQLKDVGKIAHHSFYKVVFADDYDRNESVIMEYTVKTDLAEIQCGELVMDL